MRSSWGCGDAAWPCASCTTRTRVVSIAVRSSVAAYGAGGDLRYESIGRCLGQLGHGELLLDVEDRTRVPKALRDTRRGPAHDLAQAKIHDHRQAKRVLSSADRRALSDPRSGGPHHGEPPLPEIWKQDGRIAHRYPPRPIADQRAQVAFAHLAGGTVFAPDSPASHGTRKDRGAPQMA